MHSTFNRHEPDFDVLHRVSEGLYTFVSRFLFGDILLHNRSLVVHVPAVEKDGRSTLVIVNPTELSPSVQKSIHQIEQQLGATVRYLISPGDWHHLFIGPAVNAFPQARAYIPPGRIPSQNPAYEYTTIDLSTDHPFPELRPHLEVLLFRGLLDVTDAAKQRPRHELVFFHPASRAITSGDVLFYSSPETMSPQEKARGLRPGILGFHFLQWGLVRDPESVARALEQMIQWDFEHYISIHGGPGNMLERDAKAHIERLLTWAENPPNAE